MNPLEGLVFLFACVAVFVLGIVFLVVRERSRRTPRRTVAHFLRSRRALRRIFRAHLALREAARSRSHAAHPSRRDPKSARRSA